MPSEQLGGLLAAVRLHHRRDHVGAALQPAVRLAEHGVGLADAGRGAEIDAQLPALALVVASLRYRLVGGGHMLIIHPSDQLFTGYFWSRSRLSWSTLTGARP